MSSKEMCINLIDNVPEYKIGYVLAYLQGLIADEEADDAFCECLFQDYLADDDKDESFTLDECKQAWGIE